MDNENKPIMETEPFDYKEDNSDMKMKLNIIRRKLLCMLL